MPSHYLNQWWNIVNWTPGTNFSEILIEIHIFSFRKMNLKITFAKWPSSCLSLNVLNFLKDHLLFNWHAMVWCHHTTLSHTTFPYVCLNIIANAAHVLKIFKIVVCKTKTPVLLSICSAGIILGLLLPPITVRFVDTSLWCRVIYGTSHEICTGLTHWGHNSWPPFSRWHFQLHFLEWKCLNFD